MATVHPQTTTASGADVRVRFCPSPTGLPHVGMVRTALYNWAYARHTGGKLVFRVEDTDAARDSEESYRQLVDALTWLKIDWDEGVEKGGPHEPYRQSQRTPVYAQNARGETYGSAMLAFQPADEPDLILAQATNGKVGYVRAAELDAASGADIDRPKDALTWTSRLDAAASTGRLAAVPVYLVDGRTVIGVFEITNPEAPANTAESR